MARRAPRYTVYDALEAKGFFEANPANSDNEQHEELAASGAFDFPKMLYHPKGHERVIQPAEIVVTPFGPKELNEHRELIYEVVSDAETEAKLLAKGWHRHPADAMRAAGKDAPASNPSEKINELQAQIAKLQAQLGNANAERLAESNKAVVAGKAEVKAAKSA